MYSSTGFDASNFVASFNRAFVFIAGISLLLLTALTITMIWFVIRYRSTRNRTAIQNRGVLWLEITWTVVPIMLALAMFWFGWEGWQPTYNPPKEGLNVTSTARMWNFSFGYENGRNSKDLVIQVNTPVKIKLVSLDVIHSIFIPAFRVKADIVPGREKVMWFIPQSVGDFDLYCAEYCGLQHSYMNAKVKVLAEKDFKAWYSDTSAARKTELTATAVPAGLRIMTAQGCNACHSTDGTRIVGPTYLGLYGSTQVVLRDGKEVTVTVDDAYIKRSIVDPNIEIVKGYPKGLMQSYSSTLSDDDIAKITEYLKSIGKK